MYCLEYNNIVIDLFVVVFGFCQCGCFYHVDNHDLCCPPLPEQPILRG